MNPNEIGDFDVVEHDGKLHLFYLSLPSHDVIGHLESEDGINWIPLPAAIRTGDPGQTDADQIWTMGLFKHGRRWHMLYTANLDRGLRQVINLATSDDLIHWQKHKHNPVLEPDARWYEHQQHGACRIDWRDPHIVKRDDVYHAFLCARENHGPSNARGCAAYATSIDGVNWQAHPPASTPRNCYDYECPSVFELDGRFYMVAIHGSHDRTTYRVASNIHGPYRRLHDDSITPGRNASLRPCVWKGKTWLFHWNRGQADWPAHFGKFVCLSSPKRAYTNPQGQLSVTSGDWSAMHDGPAMTPDASTPAFMPTGHWQWDKNRLTGSCESGGATWLTRQMYKDFELCFDVRLADDEAACVIGTAVRTDAQSDTGIFPTLDLGRRTAELVKLVHARPRGEQSQGRGRSVLQTYHLPAEPTRCYRIRLIAFGPNIELNVNDRLVLSHLTMPARQGHAGLYLEDGKAEFSNIQLTPLHEPRTNWGW